MNLSLEGWKIIAASLGLAGPDPAILSVFTSGMGGVLRTSEVVERMGNRYSRQFVIRRLNALVGSGLLDRVGGGPQTRYVLDEGRISAAYIEVDHLLRPNKRFDADLILKYKPRETRILPTNVSEELRRISGAAIRSGDTINQIVFRRYMIDFAWASSRMEGNTYSLLSTQALLNEGVADPKHTHDETQMLRNHAAAIQYLLDNARDLRITSSEIRGLHRLLSKELLPNPEDEGRVRRGIVEIGHSAYRPASIPQVIEECLDAVASHAREVTDPYEASMLLFVQLSYLQPFMDVNKRTARVACNIPLLKAGLCPLSFFGIDDQAYIQGLLAYYETHATALLVAVYRDGYRAAAERYRSYGVRLSDKLKVDGGARRSEVEDLVKKYIRAVARGDIEPEEKSQFLRGAVQGTDPMLRDTVLADASHMISTFSEQDAVGLAIPKALFQRYQDALDASREDRAPRGG